MTHSVFTMFETAESFLAGEAAWYSLSDGRLYRAVGLQRRGSRFRAGEALGAGVRCWSDEDGRLWAASGGKEDGDE